jgi:hypothetical protein
MIQEDGSRAPGNRMPLVKVVEVKFLVSFLMMKYYDYWGSRVYAFVSDPKNVRLNYKAAKKIGANYVISKFNLESESLELKCLECKNKLYLYKIL